MKMLLKKKPTKKPTKQEDSDEEEPVKKKEPKKSTPKKPKKPEESDEEAPVKKRRQTKKAPENKWTPDDVIKWLTDNKYNEFIPAFQNEQIDGSMFLKLTEEDLVDMGLSNVPRHKRLRLIIAIDELSD